MGEKNSLFRAREEQAVLHWPGPHHCQRWQGPSGQRERVRMRSFDSFLEISSVHGWETQQGNQHHSRHFSLALFCGLESNLNGKWREFEDKSEKENGTKTRREEIKGVESGLEKLFSVSFSPYQKEVFYFPWKETKWTAGTIVVARTPGDVLAAVRARWQG